MEKTLSKGLICCVLSLTLFSIALSQPKGTHRGVAVSPTIITILAKPGESKIATFRITNPSTKARQSYVIEASDLSQDETGNILPVSPGLGTRSCVAWISVIPEAEIAPESSDEINVSVRCPPNATGSYYAIISVAPKQIERGAPMAVIVSPKIAIRLQVDITGIAKIHLEPKELSYQPSSSSGPAALVMKVENTGLTKVPVEGDLIIYGKLGQFPDRTSIPYRDNGTAFEIYPNMAMVFSCPLKSSLESGSHKVNVRLRLAPKVESKKDFELIIPGKSELKESVVAKAGKKSELDVDLFIEPDVFELAIPSGGSRTIPIKITNRDTRVANIRAQVTQSVMESDGMLTFLETPSESSNWLSLQSDTLTIGPNQSKAFRLLASIPKGMPVSYPLMGVVRLQAEAQKTEYHDDWSSGGEFSSIIMVTDPKTPAAKIEIANIDLIRPAPEKNPGAAVVHVQNKGGKVAKIAGTIILARKSGQEILRMDIGKDKYELVLPGKEREFRLPLGPLDKGDFRVFAEFAMAGPTPAKIKKEVTFSSFTEL